MNYKTDYHIHTTYCDGKSTPSNIVKKAISKNINIIGFSGHSMNPFAETWHIAPNEHENYINEINSLKEKYKNDIQILRGFEADYIPSLCEPSFNRFKNFFPEYLIGSVHYIVTKNGFFTIDDSVENVKEGIDKLFNGNGKKVVQEYFYLEREMIKNCDFTILGHLDLVRKRNDILHFFNEDESWYKKELKELVKEIKKTNLLIEINTGAISRKIMNDVYPSSYMLELLHNENIPIIFSSDSHTEETLCAHFDKAKEAAIKAGYKEHAILIPAKSNKTKATIKMQPIL